MVWCYVCCGWFGFKFGVWWKVFFYSRSGVFCLFFCCVVDGGVVVSIELGVGVYVVRGG